MINDYLRPFWMPGLNEVTGLTDHRFLDFVNDKKSYVIYNQLRQTEFKLSIINIEDVLRSIACDINRFGCASIETISEINYNKPLSKSHAWKCIKAYYAAYYSAHAILRLAGISCTNFELIDLKNVETIADLYGFKNGIQITKGYYKCTIDAKLKTVKCEKISVSNGLGSHEQLWLVFFNFIENIISQLATSRPTIELQSVISKLQDLKDNLKYMGSNGGNWLSKVRNEINYKHLDGMWFPYKDVARYLESMALIIKKWELDPMQVDLTSYAGKYYFRFASTCIFITALFRSMAIDMSDRCSKKGKSFHKTGILALLNRLSSI